MRVLVTGGSGYLGGELIKALAKVGHTPTNFDLLRDPQDDIRSPSAVHQAVYNVEAVFHLAFPPTGQGEKEHPFWYWDHICNGTKNVADACNIEGVRLIFVSNHVTDQDSICPHCGNYRSMAMQAKKEAERIATDVKNSIVVRVPNIYDLEGRDKNLGRLFPRLVKMAKAEKVVRIYPPEDTVVELVHVQDCARTLVTFITGDTGVVQLQGKRYTIRHIADSVAQLHGARVEVAAAPPSPVVR